MRTVKWALLAATALAFTPSAQAAPIECVAGSFAAYENLSVSGCTIAGVTFSDFTVNVKSDTTFGVQPMLFVNFGHVESGLLFNVLPLASIQSEFDISFDVDGNMLGDAFLANIGNGTLTETFNGTLPSRIEVGSNSSLSLNLALVRSLVAVINVPTTSSIVLAAFSLGSPGTDIQAMSQTPLSGALPSQTPLPGALPLFVGGLALLGFVGWRKQGCGRISGLCI